MIGINTAIITGGRGNEGVGFALPSNTAIGVYNQIITNGKVTRGSIGVSFTETQGSQSDRSERTRRILRDRIAARGTGQPRGKSRPPVRRRHYQRERQTGAQRK